MSTLETATCNYAAALEELVSFVTDELEYTIPPYYIHRGNLENLVGDSFNEKIKDSTTWGCMKNVQVGDECVDPDETFKEFVSRQSKKELTEFSPDTLGDSGFTILTVYARDICNRVTEQILEDMGVDVDECYVEEPPHINFLYAWYALSLFDDDVLVKACKD